MQHKWSNPAYESPGQCLQLKKILIAGASTYGVGNMGDDAMLKTLTTELHHHLDCEIVFLARHPDSDYDARFGIKSIKNYEHDTREESVGRWFFGFNRDDPRRHLRILLDQLDSTDLVVIGGNAFMEVSPNSLMRGVSSYCTLLATLAMCFDRPYGLYGVAGHTLVEETTRQAAKFLCSNASFTTVREQFFADQLLSVGVAPENISVFADPAFGLRELGSEDRAIQVLNENDIVLEQRPTIGLAIRHMYWKWDDSQTASFFEKTAFLCDELIQSLDCQLLFIPNCTYHLAHPLQDDRVVARRLRELVSRPERFHCPNTNLTLTDTLSLYHMIDMLWSNRRHANIFAALVGRAFLPMASTEYEWQFRPFLEDLGIDVPLLRLDTDSAASILNALKEVWNRRDEIVDELSSRLPDIQTAARDQVRLIADLLR